MGVTPKNWKNKNGTTGRRCSCGSWKQHWLNYSRKSWPKNCSVYGCTTKPTLGAHIIHTNVSGEKIVPMCNSCNSLSSFFSLNVGVTLINANKSQTCNR